VGHGAGGAGTTGRGPAQEAQDPGVAQLRSPGTAGRPRARVIAGDNDPFVIGIEHRLKCNCGCAHSLYACRTTDFSCGFWQELHAEVIAMAEQNMTAEEIVDAYVTKHGELYLMAPVPEGFNITGYLLPGAVISSIAAVMIWVMKRKAVLAAVPVQDGVASSLSAADQARLEAEMRELDL
jgi:cytochrome c-type biogenesis protein CcmH